MFNGGRTGRRKADKGRSKAGDKIPAMKMANQTPGKNCRRKTLEKENYHGYQ
jgi:hypothetical protein